MTKKLKIEVGSYVAFNTLEDATWFKVLSIEGFCMEIAEDGYAPQYADISMVRQVRKP